MRLNALKELYDKSYAKFKRDSKGSVQMSGLKDKSSPESASLVMVASALLNMDEWLNKN